MEKQIEAKDFRVWLKEQEKEGFFIYFLSVIEEQLQSRTPNALKRGDTDFEKGYIDALKWVLEQPENLSNN